MHRRLASVLLLAACLATGSCADPVEPPGGDLPGDPPAKPPVGPPGTGPESLVALHITAPGVLELHGAELLTITGITRAGYSVVLPGPPVLSSSDPATASVSPAGVVTGLLRGTATITARYGALVSTLALTVRTRVRIEPGYSGNTYWPMAAGDTLQFTAALVDANGIVVESAPAVTWASNNPTVSVSAAGQVISSQVNEAATITATAADGSASVDVVVSDVLAGQPAIIRFAHAALGVGPITFVPSRGEPVTLTYGQAIERPVMSGSFTVQTTGLPAPAPFGIPSGFVGVIRGGDHLTLFAVGGANYASVAPIWTTPASVAPDSGLVRIVQGWTPFPVVYIRPTGAAADGLPEQCYFDPMNASPYYPLAAGGFDLILQQKYGSPTAPVRLPVAATAGHGVTMVLVGDSPATAGVVTFADF